MNLSNNNEYPWNINYMFIYGILRKLYIIDGMVIKLYNMEH